jgi:hypothetical protein
MVNCHCHPTVSAMLARCVGQRNCFDLATW